MKLILVFIFFSIYAQQANADRLFITDALIAKSLSKKKTTQKHIPNKILMNPQNKNIYSINLLPPSEFDFISKDKIFKHRYKYISRYPNLINQNYYRTDAVYGQISSDKAWWGQIGSNCTGKGMHSNEGLSKESIFLNNPLLLIGISTIKSEHPDWNCKGFYPVPISLKFQPSKKRAVVTYQISSFFTAIKDTPWEKLHKDKKYIFTFKTENARDFDYKYAYIEDNQNIDYQFGKNLANTIRELNNFIGVDFKCGYPGGCNDGDPKNSIFNFDINEYPTMLKIKLWKERPEDKNSQSDLDFYINLK